MRSAGKRGKAKDEFKSQRKSRIKWPMEMAKRSGERSGEPGNSTTERRFVCRKGSRVRKSEKGHKEGVSGS